MRPRSLLPVALSLLLAGPAALAQPGGNVAAPAPEVPLEGREQVCARLWQDYMRSQACFNRFRVVGGGLKQEAYASCGQPLPDPSAQCGPRR